MRFDGTDRRTHVRVVGKTGDFGDEPEPADVILMRPDGRWALALVTNQLYLLALPRFGGEAPKIDRPRRRRPAQEAHRHRRRLRWPGPTAARRSPGPSAPASSACRSIRRLRALEDRRRRRRRTTRRRPRRRRRKQKPKPEEIAVVVERPRSRPEGLDRAPRGQDHHHAGRRDHPEGEIVVTDHRIVAVGPDGQGRGARGGEGHRRRRDDDRPGLRRHARPLDRDPPRRPRPPELELLRQPRLRRDHRPRPADRHERHVRLSGPGRDRRAGRPAGVLDRAGRLLRHRLPVGRGSRRRWSPGTRSTTARTP